MKIFSSFDVYDSSFTYEEMKVMAQLTKQQGIDCLDYEDLMRICRAVYDHWVDGRDESEDEKYATYPWLEFETEEEDAYIQTYLDVPGGSAEDAIYTKDEYYILKNYFSK